MPSGIKRFFSELKRRKVYHVAVVYVVVGWGVSQGAEFLFGDVLGLDPVIWQLVIGLIVLGFPIALVLAWAYELRPEERQAPTPKSGTPEVHEPVHRDRKAIVVLPFENLSPDPGLGFFSDGLTEELISRLSRIRELLVISRTSAMSFRGTTKTIPSIARELHVRYVLEGSVRRAGNDLRITTQLIDATTDTHLWAETFDGTLGDVFHIQEGVSRSIVDALEIQLTDREDRQVTKRSFKDVQAYDCYLRARAAIWRRTEEAYDEATRQLQAGLEMIGENARLLGALAYVQVWYVQGWFRGDEALDGAEEYARRSLALDSETALAHVALGFAGFFRGNKRWLTSVERGCALDPSDPETLHLLGWGYVMTGQTARALDVGQRMARLDPLSHLSRGWIGVAQFYAGQFRTAVESLKVAESSELLEQPMFRWYLPYFLVYADQRQEALALLQTFGGRSNSDFFTQFSRILLGILEGEKDRSLDLFTPELVSAARRDAAASCWAATLLAMSDDPNRSMEWLEHAVDRGFINYPYLAEYDPFLAKLRDHDRYGPLMSRVKQEWQAFGDGTFHP